MQKISKAEAGFQCKPNTEYTCADCAALKPTKKGFGCALFGPGEPVSDSAGGCNYFMHGAADQLPWMGTYSKLELGYIENKRGFSCKRCEYFSPAKRDCSKVDRDSPGDAPGEIQPSTCCNLWEADQERAKMKTPELLVQIANAAKEAEKPARKEDRRGYWAEPKR